MNNNFTLAIKKIFNEHKQFFIYTSISVLVTIIDVFVSRACELFLEPVYANTLGVIVGFIIQYILASRHVYNSKNIRTLLVFFITFLIGLLIANSIVYIFRELIFSDSNGFIPFAISKMFSIVIPFFFTYFLRKWLIK